MKKILFIVSVIAGLNSCTVKEEFTIGKSGRIQYNYSLNGSDLKDFMAEEESFEKTLNEKKDFVEALGRGITIEEFYKRLTDDHDLLKHHNAAAVKYFKENKTTYNQLKHHKLYVNFDQLTYNTELKTTSENIDQESKLLNNFLFNFFIAIDNPFNTNYLTNTKTATNNSFEISFNKTDYKQLINSLTKEFDSRMQDNMMFNKMFNYQLIIHTPDKILSSSKDGSYYTLDQKTIKLDYTFAEIISEENKSVKITF